MAVTVTIANPTETVTRTVSNANAVKIRDALDNFHEREPGETDLQLFMRIVAEHIRRLVLRSEQLKASRTAPPVDEEVLTP